MSTPRIPGRHDAGDLRSDWVATQKRLGEGLTYLATAAAGACIACSVHEVARSGGGGERVVAGILWYM